MTEIPAPASAPRIARFFRSLVIMSLVAATLVVTIVMPAEYGIDPTGIGARLGLKQMGEIKQQLIREDAAHAASEAPAAPDTSGRK